MRGRIGPRRTARKARQCRGRPEGVRPPGPTRGEDYFGFCGWPQPPSGFLSLGCFGALSFFAMSYHLPSVFRKCPREAGEPRLGRSDAWNDACSGAMAAFGLT